MIAAHHCLGTSHAACMKLLLESPPSPVDPVLWSRADPVAFPNEKRTAESLAEARGNSAALRLLAAARKRWTDAILVGERDCESDNIRQRNVFSMEGNGDGSTLSAEERRQLARAEKDRTRRRLEREAKRRDREEEVESKSKQTKKRLETGYTGNGISKMKGGGSSGC